MPVPLKVGSGLLDEGTKALDEMEEEARAAPLQVLNFHIVKARSEFFFWTNFSTELKCWAVLDSSKAD